MANPSARRNRRTPLAGRLLEFPSNRAWAVEAVDNFPPDARVYDVCLDPSRPHTVVLLTESEQWDEVQDGQGIPDFFPVYRRTD